MSVNRREFLKNSISFGACSVAAASGLLSAESANAEWVAENFAPSILEETLKNLFQDQKLIETDKINIKIPKIAENGAVVPITVTSSLDGIENISILVEKNPVPLAARFDLSPELEPFVSARLKMAETSDVIVIAQTGNNLYSARETVKVTIGGCGG
ncbi:MAG: thiosulfate oxidation carrier protein SoxY [Methylobacter sp.]|uniref:thiosulfate oxidation carrier protein SoxY n=1 Tax=Methylobacter sp. TaxID=2051955 RepID=UPI0025849F6F|nr:thiosulfate oxidation carrier protein SoxY [Methylobacter sp.]MCL7422901.1 thiosulfate oxidation carrier protein SoxY [Methylobacter sp.]